MKGLFVLYTALIFSFISRDVISGTWMNEITTGCAVVGTANYMFTETNQTENLMMGCIVGGSVGYLMKEYFKDEAANDYQHQINALKSQVDEMTTHQNINNSLGVEGTSIKFRKRKVPTKRLKNGSYQLGTFILEPVVPGQDLVIGD